MADCTRGCSSRWRRAASSIDVRWIALFPLNTVLFPGGLLPLRIFETRYVDMVSSCMRASESLWRGADRSAAATRTRRVETATVGTSCAHRRFPDARGRTARHSSAAANDASACAHRSQQADGLNRAEVDWLPEPAPAAVPEEYPAVGTRYCAARWHSCKTIGHFVEPDYDDASWVSYRMAELLPLDRRLQQQLLESDDPPERLRLLAPLIDLHAVMPRRTLARRGADRRVRRPPSTHTTSVSTVPSARRVRRR